MLNKYLLTRSKRQHFPQAVHITSSQEQFGVEVTGFNVKTHVHPQTHGHRYLGSLILNFSSRRFLSFLRNDKMRCKPSVTLCPSALLRFHNGKAHFPCKILDTANELL